MRIPAGRLLALWIAWGAALAGLEVFVWVRADTVREALTAVQLAYGVGAAPAWILCSDTHAHGLVSLLGTLWFGLGCRLFAPRAIPWLPMAAMALVALSDELVQLGSPARSFTWGDQAADAVGILLALPLLNRLLRLEVSGPRRGGDQKATAISKTDSIRS